MHGLSTWPPFLAIQQMSPIFNAFHLFLALAFPINNVMFEGFLIQSKYQKLVSYFSSCSSRTRTYRITFRGVHPDLSTAHHHHCDVFLIPLVLALLAPELRSSIPKFLSGLKSGSRFPPHPTESEFGDPSITNPVSYHLVSELFGSQIRFIYPLISIYLIF